MTAVPLVTLIYRTGVVGQCPHGVDIIATEHPPEKGMVLVSEDVDCNQCRDEYREKVREFFDYMRSG